MIIYVQDMRRMGKIKGTELTMTKLGEAGRES